jgi:hypothetical protein
MVEFMLDIEEGYGTVDWRKGKVYLIPLRSEYPSSIALFLGDQIGNSNKREIYGENFCVKILDSIL